jgi:hypothetical protein
MNSVYVEGAYIGKAKNLGHGLGLPLEGLRA